MIKKLVKVTLKHIDNGKRFDCRECPVATALTETTGCLCVCGTEVWKFYFNDNFSLIAHRFSTFVTRFIEAFDERLHVQPIEFEIEYDESELEKMSPLSTGN